jgi:hypothetical protein
LVAETQLEWGRLLRRSGFEDRAARLFDAVCRVAAGHGARFLERRCMDVVSPD